MPAFICQYCHSSQSVRQLLEIETSWVRYFRCDTCGEVWIVRVDDRQQERRIVARGFNDDVERSGADK
jgi:hypothetical protein